MIKKSIFRFSIKMFHCVSCVSVRSCQNWEGGLSGVPGLEAHGGYTFCGTAALVILGKEHMLDLKALLVRSYKQPPLLR